MEFVADASYTPVDILQSSKLLPLSKSNIGYKKSTYWSRLKLKNDSNEAQKIIFSNLRAGMDKIDVYVFKGDHIIQSFLLGDMRPITNRSYRSSHSNFVLNLAPHEEVVIVSHLKTVGAYELGWYLFRETSFLSYDLFEYSVMGLFVGFLLSMIFYNLIIYVVTRSPFYPIYILFLLTVIVSQFVIQGGLYTVLSIFIGSFDYAINNVVGFILPSLANIFWYMLILQFFDLKKNAPRWRIFFLAMNILFSIYIAVFLMAYFDPSLFGLTPLFIKISFMHLPFLMWFLVWTIYKGYFGSLYFFIASLTGKAMFILFLLNFMGVEDTSFFFQYGILLSGALSAFFLSLAITRKITMLQNEASELKERVQEQQKYAILGSTIGFIAHQWNQPLSRMGSIVTNLQSEIDHRPNQMLKEVEPSINRLEDAVTFVSQTISDIQSIFQNDPQRQVRFDINTPIEQAIKQSQTQLTSYDIELEVSSDEHYFGEGDPELLKHALFNLIQNAIQIIVDRKVSSPYIKIQSFKERSGVVVIRICDNAGGITQEDPQSIFEYHVSSRLKGSGLGLPIVKKIIELKFNGTITVHNTSDGACFTLRI